MGNGVSLMTVGNRLALANGGMKFSKRMLIEQIGLHKEFHQVVHLPVCSETVEKVANILLKEDYQTYHTH